MKRIVYILIVLSLVFAMALSLFSCDNLPITGGGSDEVSNTDVENKENSNSENKDDGKTDNDSEGDEKNETVCPACKQPAEKPHDVCAKCGEYICIGDHSKCYGYDLCYCGGGYDQGKHYVHGKCSECEKWTCEHPVCEYCEQYIHCDTFCDLKLCKGGPDCTEDCNIYSGEKCTNYVTCGRHSCEESHMHNSCDRCGKVGIICDFHKNVHNRICPVCNLADCQVDPYEPHKECEILMKACPSCGADCMRDEHRCGICQDGYICDKDGGHGECCKICGGPLCMKDAHLSCVQVCPGCSMPNENHGQCGLCNGYLCVENHSICVFCGDYLCVGNHGICEVCQNNLCAGDHEFCKSGDDYRHCAQCGETVNKAMYCYDCNVCDNCCKCSMVCPGCYVKYKYEDCCPDCMRCESCCYCLFFCEKCEIHQNIHVKCNVCGYCLSCCSGHSGGGNSSNLHPHAMTDFNPNCETYASNSHYYCFECDAIIVRIFDAAGVFLEDITCPYCVKGDGYGGCNHTGEGLHMIDDAPCGSGAHYACDYCSKLFIYDETSVTLFVECKKCIYGENYCESCNSYAENRCYDCYMCFNCCSCLDTSDLTIYCPKCRNGVSYNEGMAADCINGGIESTYTCYSCDYTYIILDGTHVECRNPMINPLGHKDSNDDYVCDNCAKLYSKDFCVVCGDTENGLYHGCEHYYFEAVKAFTWYGVSVKHTNDGYSIKISVSLNSKTSGTIYYYLKNNDLPDYVEIARITCDVTSVSGSPYVFKYTPTNVCVLQRNVLDYVNYGYVSSLEFDANTVSYIMFTRVSGYDGVDQTTYNDQLIASVLNLPFETCDDCYGVKAVGNHGVCKADECGKNTCAGHIHGVCDHENAYQTDDTVCGGAGNHYYCPSCNKFLMAMPLAYDKLIFEVCQICSDNIPFKQE